MNFKTTESLFAKIKEDFYSFDAAGLIDEGKFYKDVQYVLAMLGIMYYRDVETMVDVKNYQTCLPEGFSELEALYRCNSCGVNPVQMPEGIVFDEKTFNHYPETMIPDPHAPLICPDFWNQNPNNMFNVHRQLLIQRGCEVRTYAPPVLMRPGNVNTKRSCSKTCANHYSVSDETFNIQNRKIYVNFKEGELLICYKAFPIDEETGLPMIPDSPIIEKAIEDHIKYNIIKNLRTNGDADVAQLLPLYQQDAQLSMGKAITETKTPSFSTMVHNIGLVRKRLNIYQFPNMNGR